jgi:ribosomal-protein-alanine N-acetyltransferase
MSSSARLRPFLEDDLVLFDRFGAEPGFSEPHEWFGFRSASSYRRRWSEDGLLGSSPYCLVVDALNTGEAVGWVDWRAHERTSPGAWEIGVLIDPTARGQGLGTEAQRLLVEYLFATTSTHRVWAGTEVENTAEQRCLERCGFLREGRIRQHHFRAGRWRDAYVYGLLREDLSTPAPVADEVISPER